ncbi:MAG: toprim domain-containing protein, partial [Treponema sp.]|nr:toprim domain-containing protein [Treponema sp.]
QQLTPDMIDHDGGLLFAAEKVLGFVPPGQRTEKEKKALADKVNDVKAQIAAKKNVDTLYQQFTGEDITLAQNHLAEMPENQRRGLTLDTLKHFGCGYIGNWVHPRIRAKAQTGQCKMPYSSTRRIVVPRENGYLACALLADREKIDKEYWKQQCGQISLFNAEALDTTDIVIVTEGEIDAMSIWQADNTLSVVACPGGNSRYLTDALREKEMREKTFMILFDNDGAGKLHASTLQEELTKRGHFAVSTIFEDDWADDPDYKMYMQVNCAGQKLDANFFLQEFGEEPLRKTLVRLIANALEKIKAARKEKFVVETQDYLNLSFEQKSFLFAGGVSDGDYVDRLIYLFPYKFRYLALSNQWLVFCPNSYGGGVWKNWGSNEPVMYQFWDMLSEAMIENAADDDDQNQKRNLAMGKRLRMYKHVHSATKKLKGNKKIHISEDDFNAEPHLLNCLNGVIDLRTGDLFAVRPNMFLAQQVPVVYRPNYYNPDVMQFLREIIVTEELEPDPKTLEALQIALGSCLTGDVCNHKVFFFWGKGRNGKGTLTRLLKRVLGVLYSCDLDIENFLIGAPRGAGLANPDFRQLRGRRLAVIEEMPANRRFNPETIKKMSGGDRITARALYENFMGGGGFDPSHHLVFSGNNLPSIDDINDPALLYRIVNFNFNRTFADNPDLNLDEKLSTPEALSGMLTWLVDGAQKWYRNEKRLAITTEMTQATNRYLADNNWFEDFISDYCLFGEDCKITRKAFLETLRKLYPKQCAKFKGQKALTENILSQFATAGYEIRAEAGSSRTSTLYLHGVKLAQ